MDRNTAPVSAMPPVTQPGERGRQSMIAESAYYRAEKRGFASGKELEDWLAAENEINALTRAAV